MSQELRSTPEDGHFLAASDSFLLVQFLRTPPLLDIRLPDEVSNAYVLSNDVVDQLEVQEQELTALWIL